MWRRIRDFSRDYFHLGNCDKRRRRRGGGSSGGSSGGVGVRSPVVKDEEKNEGRGEREQKEEE